MILRGIFRGGLTGGLLAVAFSVLGVIPICGFFALPLRLVAWTFAGYVAGNIAVRGGVRSGGVVAGLGAGVLAGILDGIANIALSPLAFKLAGSQIAALLLLPDSVIQYFLSLGIDLSQMNTVGGSIFFATMTCSVLWLLAGLMGMLGGGVAQALAD